MRDLELQEIRERVLEEAERNLESVRVFLVKGLQDRELSTADLVAITGLSINTVRAALRKGARPNAITLGMIGAAIGLDIKLPRDKRRIEATTALAAR